MASMVGNGLVEQPNTVEDFFRLCSRLVQHCAPIFLSSTNFDLCGLFDMSLRSIDLPTIAASPSNADDVNASNKLTSIDPNSVIS